MGKRVDFDWTAAIWEAGDEFARKECRRAVKTELRSLPKWSRGAEPGVILLRPAAITAAAIRAHCRICKKCPDMAD